MKKTNSGKRRGKQERPKKKGISKRAALACQRKEVPSLREIVEQKSSTEGKSDSKRNADGEERRRVFISSSVNEPLRPRLCSSNQ